MLNIRNRHSNKVQKAFSTWPEFIGIKNKNGKRKRYGNLLERTVVILVLRYIKNSIQ